MSPEAQTGIAAIISLIVGYVVRYFMGGSSPAPAKPSTPSDPAAPAVPDSDPFKKLPGVPGHPLMNLIWARLQDWLQGKIKAQSFQSFVPLPPVDPTDALIDDATMAVLATALKADPERLAKIKSMLN